MTAVIDAPVRSPSVGGVHAEPASAEAVAALVRACSPGSLRRRFFLPVDRDPQVVLARYRRFLLTEPPGVAEVVVGGPVGLLNVVLVADGLAEAGLRVADAWPRRGVAGELIAKELTKVWWAGWTVGATVQPQGRAARELIRAQRVGGSRLVAASTDEWEYAITLPPSGSGCPSRRVPR